MTPYYQDEHCAIYHGDMRVIAPHLSGISCVITDPPYAETDLEWDVWPAGWLSSLHPDVLNLWCFGSFRMFIDRRDEFLAWRLAQEIIWEKHNGSGLHVDRFRRVHEIAAQFYRGQWREIFKCKPVIKVHEPVAGKTATRRQKPKHYADIEKGTIYRFSGSRIRRSVIRAKSCHGTARNPTQKPAAIILPLMEYSVPIGGIVLDPFMGSGSVLRVAKDSGRRAIGIDSRLSECKAAAEWLSQGALKLHA